MMEFNTEHFSRCVATLGRAFNTLQELAADDELHDIYRAACVKEFEIILEQAGRLLKKCLAPYFTSSKQADCLTFKDIFRHAAKHGLIHLEESERWLAYRDNRNDTAHDYGEKFAEDTLRLLPMFIADARNLRETMRRHDPTLADPR